MAGQVIVLSIFAGVFFGIWPLVMRCAKEVTGEFHFVFTCLLLQIGSMVVYLPLVKDHVSLGHILTWGTAIGLLAGILNGFGQLAFQNLITSSTNNPGIEISRFTVIVVMVQIALGVLGGRVLFGEPLTLKKMVGLSLATIAVLLMRSR